MVDSILILVWFLLVAGVLTFLPRAVQARRARHRLFATVTDQPAIVPLDSNEPRYLGRWLFLAGFRSPAAASVFVAATLVLLTLGIVSAILIQHSGLIERGLVTISAFPGGALDILAPVLYAAPWLALGFGAMLPWIAVRSARRERVLAVEQDLPVTLEILSTLAEAGMSFDPALDRVLASQPITRPLARELRTFRDETLAGRPRVQSFRRLSRRVEVTSLSTFISAMVQAEQSGAGIAAVLRQQADDLRNRRRERALEAATALPVKRLIPLFICFLPGIFVWALGPSFYQLIRFVDVFTRNRGMR